MKRLLLVTTLTACTSPNESDTARALGDPQALRIRSIAPDLTGPGIDTIDGVHHRVAIGSGAVHRLMIFFPGTGATPDMYTMIANRAAERGYHVIGLAYDNRDEVNGICSPFADEDCEERVRIEVLVGTESGYNPPDVDRANSAVNRIVQLLQYLDERYPSEGWGSYLDRSGAMRWSDTVIAGHSQGGGHAAMVGKLFAVSRVAMFDATEPADWTTEPFVTAASRFSGFAHQDESGFDPITKSWDNIGIAGPPQRVDLRLPAPSIHQLYTATKGCRDPGWGDVPHDCPIADDFTPLAPDGTPVFGPVWDRMVGL